MFLMEVRDRAFHVSLAVQFSSLHLLIPISSYYSRSQAMRRLLFMLCVLVTRIVTSQLSFSEPFHDG